MKHVFIHVIAVFFVFGIINRIALAENQDQNFEQILAQLTALDLTPEKCFCELKQILEGIKPVKVTASKSLNEDYSAGDIKNIMTTHITLIFWNVGALKPGYEKVTMNTKITSSLTGESQQNTATGFFTGGPNGQIWLDLEGLRTRITLQGGKTMIVSGEATEGEKPEDMVIPIQNPDAFSSWPPMSEMARLQQAIQKQQKQIQLISNMTQAIQNMQLNCARNIR